MSNWDESELESRSLPQSVPEQPTRSFCSTCGEPIYGQVECPVCAEKAAWQASQEPIRVAEAGSVKSALVLYFILIATFVFLFIDPEDVRLRIFVSALDAVIVLIWCLMSWRQFGPLLKIPNPLWLLLGGVIGVGTFLATTIFIELLVALLNMPVIEMTTDFRNQGYGLATILLVIVVQPAIIEEFAFRGVIFTKLKQQLTVTEAMLVSTFMFSILHLSVFAFPHTFVIGLIAVMLVQRTGSLWPGVCLHGVHNFLVVASELWF